MATAIGDNVVVIDHDDDFVKAGYPIPDREPLIAPNLVRRVGDDGAPLRPVHERRVVDWDQLESVYAHIFYRQLGWIEGDEGAALVTEPILTSRADRDRLTQMMFESFNVAGLYIVDQPVAALYGVGKTSGVSVDVGYAVTDVAPVVDGAVVTPAAQRRRVGSSHVSAALRAALGDDAAKLSDADVDAARDAVCVVAPARDGTRDGTRSAPSDTAFTLPDGNVLRVPGAARLACGDAAFDPPGGGAAISNALVAAVEACTPDQRRVCLDAVHVSGWWAGGAGRHAGVETRAMRDLEDALPPSQKPIAAGAPEYMPDGAAMYPAWFGGAVLAKVVFAQQQHVSKIEYQENGPTATTRGR